ARRRRSGAFRLRSRSASPMWQLPARSAPSRSTQPPTARSIRPNRAGVTAWCSRSCRFPPSRSPLRRRGVMATIKRILVPVDFSDCSRAALEYAAALGHHFHASIDVLHVWEPPRQFDPYVMLEPRPDGRTLKQFVRTGAARTMTEFLGALKNPRIAPLRGRLATGAPPAAILAVAADGEYDLIVMGTHGRAHILLGSVTRKVMRHASCPVVTVRPSRTAEPIAERTPLPAPLR